ncbi:hypothetical protein K470DRAFT_267621 [Piedraia hortae CBS 480.64]|uniref:BZIP domain-containing protein n=1 Tax=Piedraia hortae CBS 480.64 TaxID=1314780 RepID=A0A6A7C9S2_9PEZI|nr:hypothetical protein K470DRAFT_267621 [Piedraia hortae CBS 480.64]
MAMFNGKRIPNLSQYIADLNQPVQEYTAPDYDRLDLLTTTNYFDFDALSAPPEDKALVGDFQASDFQTNDFQVGEFDATDLKTNEFQNTNFKATDFQAYPPVLPYAPMPEMMPTPISGTTPATKANEAAQLAAEEDKRRRNTAASARFRVKKKQREQALEKQNREMGIKLKEYEAKIEKLEQENEWLRDLVTKSGHVLGGEPKGESV